MALGPINGEPNVGRLAGVVPETGKLDSRQNFKTYQFRSHPKGTILFIHGGDGTILAARQGRMGSDGRIITKDLLVGPIQGPLAPAELRRQQS